METMTYTQAQKVLQANKKANITNVVRWNAGDGFTGEGYWCDNRKRIITSVVTAEGFRII